MDRTALPPGARLGEFEIVRVLANGGFGIVYQAHDRALDRVVAVKEFMPTHLAGRSDGQRVAVRSSSDAATYALGLQSFIDEAKLLAHLSHPAIVKVYHFWKGNGTGYMVMPYLRGPTLSTLRRTMADAPTEAWLRRMISPLLDALALLHAEGIYHRDISPDNVLVDENRLPVLLDFGAARRVIANRTQTVTAIVKPHFAPIEQYAEARMLKQGPWTDLYALGALVSYLIEGTPPPASTARSIHDDRVPLAERRIPGCSPGFLAVIDWMLAVRPQDRPQNVAALRDALARREAPNTKSPKDASTAKTGLGLLAWRPGAPRREGLSRPAWAVAATMAAVAVGLAFTLVRGPVGIAAASSAPVEPHATPAAIEARTALATASPPATEATATATPSAPATSLATAAPIAQIASISGPPREEFIEGPPERIIDTPPSIDSAFAPAPGSTPVSMSTPGHRVKSSASKPRKVASRSKPVTERRLAAASARPRAPGPVELCAAHNFFLRGWCVQRRCDEPRFKGNAECRPAPQVARSY